MQHQLSEHRQRIQELRAQLDMAQHLIREGIQGKIDYEQRVYYDMQNLMG